MNRHARTRKQICTLLPRRGRDLVRAARWVAMMQAYARRAAKTAKGRKIIAADWMAHNIKESRALGEQGTMAGNNFVSVHRQLIIDGNGDNESVSLLYGWMGNMMTAMLMRYQRGNRTMRLGLLVMHRGRKALRGAYRRWQKHKRTGFNGEELQDFEAAFDLGIQVAPSLSKKELREVFRIADARAKATNGNK